MTDFIKAITYNYPSEIPITTNLLPAMWIHYGNDMVDLAKEYSDFIPDIPDLETLEETMDIRYKLGNYTDEWGCVWSNVDKGMVAIVTEHPLKTREDILSLEIPKNRDGNTPHGLMYLRLLDLRGFEEAMIDFADECDEIQVLIDKVLEYNCIQIEYALPKSSDVFYLGDDLGMQKGLAIGADRWRKYLKPCFMKMFGMVRDAKKYVYMHTDGMIYEIIPDLIECGAHMINPQIRANGLDNLVRTCKGKIAINLDLDRQLFPFATPSEIDDHVRECVEALYLPQGGLGLNIELNYEIPLTNVAAIFDAVRRYKTYR